MASIYIDSVSQTGANIYVGDLNYQYCYNNLNGSSYPRYGSIEIIVNGVSISQTIAGAGTYGGTTGYSVMANFSGLNPGTQYSVTANIPWYSENYISNPVWELTFGQVTLNSSVTTQGTAVRPPSFNWSYAKTQGGDFNLKAFEWNDFMDNINLVRDYKGYGQIWYTTALMGNTFTSNMYDQAHSAVNEMYNYMSTQGKSYINSITSTGWNTGQAITANHLNYIVSALNSIT